MASCRQPVKIVLINTQYVQTDETSFKSVVQELTGKDAGERSTSEGRRRRGRRMVKREEEMMEGEAAKVEMARKSAILMRDMSFKEFDRLLKEMPVDELYGLWAN